MKSLKPAAMFCISFVACILLTAPHSFAAPTEAQADNVVVVKSLDELAKYATRSNVSVRLEPDTYRLDNDATSQLLELPRYRDGKVQGTLPVATLLHFSGNNSHYDFTGATINIDTHLHQAFPKKTDLHEVLITGHGNTLEGLTLHDDGDHVPTHGATMIVVVGNKNTISNADLYIHGSSPYGYGHLLGKGRGALTPMRKHCGILISGKNNQLIGSKVRQYAFGHGIFMQGAVDTLIKNCYVEGEMRTTDEMLAETSGLAFDAGFKSTYPPGEIVPGQIKCLAEDGIRTYAAGAFVPHRTERVTVIDCTIKNMRAGVCLGFEKGPSKIINTTTIGHQERGFSIGTNGVIKNSRGDAMYGPLLTFLGPNYKNCTIDLELIDTVSAFPVPRLLEINGTGHRITLKNYQGKQRPQDAPIVFGESDWGDIHLFRTPDSDPRRYSGAKDCTLINQTGMPIVFSDLASDCRAITNGKVLRDDGKDNQVKYQP